MATAVTAGSIGLGVFGAALLAQPAGAVTATLTVATTGTDTGNCVGSSCATLGYALSKAAAGDIIMIQPGTYMASADPAANVEYRARGTSRPDHRIRRRTER